MFILNSTAFPDTKDNLTREIKAGLDARLSRAGGASVLVDGEFPNLNSVQIDLSNGRIDAAQAKVDVKVVGPTTAGPSAKTFSLTAKPVHFEDVLADLTIIAADVSFDYAHNKSGRAMLLLNKARDGKISLAISQRDLESAVMLAARTAAAGHGVAVQKAAVSLTSVDARTVDVDVTITAKKMMTAIIRVRGRAQLDEQLNATFSKIQADGEGMVASIAVGMLRPKLKMIDGKKFPLSAISLGNVRLKDVTISTTNGVRVEAEFG